MFNLLLAELFGKDSGGVALLEGVFPWKWVLKFQTPMAFPVFLSLSLSSLSSLTPFLCPAVDQDVIAQL